MFRMRWPIAQWPVWKINMNRYMTGDNESTQTSMRKAGFRIVTEVFAGLKTVCALKSAVCFSA